VPEIEDLSGRKLGEFVLRARIGAGAFGAVYRCEQPLLGRDAVVKVLHPPLRHNSVVRQRFLREAQLASQLDHPGAAHIYAFGIERDDGLFWIAMEMLQGVALNRWLHEHGPMPLDGFVPFFEQLAEVVHAAHERGIVHRDLKPSNVMVIERAGRLMPKLLDFGVAKLLDGAPAQRTAAAMDASGNAGGAETVALVAGSKHMSGSTETVTQTSSEPHSSVRDQLRLTHRNSTVGSPPYMSPEQWTNAAEVEPSSDLYSLGVLAYEAITGRRPFNAASTVEYADLHCDAAVPPVGEALPAAFDRFFARALAKRPEQRWGTALELAAALRAEWIATRVSGAARAGRESSEAGFGSDDEAAPYLGLAPYVAGDTGRYVGREAEVAAFLERLRTQPLHVVVGPPGTGKSSFVHAGVLSGLPEGWRTVTLRPGAAPLAALAFRLAAVGVPGDDLRVLLASSPAEAAARVAEVAGVGIVVVIDQLEELFTLGASADEREQFAAVVAQLSASADLPVRVIATIRDDNLMQLDGLPALRPRLGSALVLLGNPLHDDLVRVVVEPARRVGYTLSDPELAHDMVRAVASRSGALALLSFTALRLWELRDRTLRQLTRSAYDAMDGVAGALVRHAEATFEALSADERRLAREIFRQLVTADGARAPLSVDELHQRLAARRSEEVLDRLIAARLIATSEADTNGARRTQVEVIHDALLEAWPRLRRWIREDIDGMRMREQLRVAARQWADRGLPRGQLWRDDALVDLQRWLRQTKTAQLSELEVAFVEASRRLARLGRVRLGLVAIGFAIAFAVFGYYTLQSRVVRHVVEERLSQVYADWGQEALLDERYVEALIYLDVAAHRGETSPRVNFTLARAAEPFEHQVAQLRSSHGRIWWASYSHDGRRIVTTNDDGAQVWDAGSPRQQLFAMHHGATAYQAEFTPDDRRVVTAGADGLVDVWDASNGQLIWPLHHEPSSGEVLAYFALAISPDGALVAATDITGGIVHVWDLRTGEFVRELIHASPIRLPALAFSSDGAWLATTAGDETHVYDTKHWTGVLTIPGPGIGTLSFDPTGPRLATGTQRGDVSIWAVPGGARVQHLRDTGDKVNHVAFSADGAFVVAAAQDGVDRIWDARTGGLHGELKSHRSSASLWAEFDPTSHLVVSTDGNGEVVISDVALRMKVSTLRALELIRAPHFDPHSQYVLGASWDGTARVWNTERAYLRWATEPPGGQCTRTMRADIDRRFIAVACSGHGTQIWDTHAPSRARSLAELPASTPVPGDVLLADPVVNADGDRAAVASDHMVTIYELPGGRVVGTVQHGALVTAIAFAAVGRDLVTGSADGSLRLTREEGEQRELTRLPAPVDVTEFLADGRIVVADARPRLGLYDVVRRTPILEQELPARALALRASSDARRVLAIPNTGSVSPLVLWDLAHPELSAQLETGKAPVLAARFVLDNRKILTASGDGTARLWDAETGRHQKSYLASSFVADADIDPSGTMVVTVSGDGVLRFWDASSGHVLWNLRAHRAAIVGVHFDGTSVVTRAVTGEVARWELPLVQKLGLTVDGIVRCLPVRFDDETGSLVEQDPRCGT
jgi:WD40 repeat protein/serine/threonine protein kinase